MHVLSLTVCIFSLEHNLSLEVNQKRVQDTISKKKLSALVSFFIFHRPMHAKYINANEVCKYKSVSGYISVSIVSIVESEKEWPFLE